MIGVPDKTNRYLPRVQPGGDTAGGDEIKAVANVAALAALPTALLDDGAGVNMRSVLDQWMLDKTSPLVPDNITVVAALGGGNWVRELLGNETWRRQAAWWIDAAAGNDENVGNAANPLATWAELMRRVGKVPIPIAMTVNFASNLNEDIEVTCVTDPDTGSLTLQGVQTAFYNGTVTGFQAINAALNNDGRITDAAIPVSWTASGLVQQGITLTSGANAGAFAWVMADLGANTCRQSRFYNEGGALYPDPAIADNYSVVTLTQINGALRGVEGGSLDVEVRDLYFVDAGQTVLEVHGGTWTFRRCNFDGAVIRLGSDGAFVFWACRLHATTNIPVERSAVTFRADYVSSQLLLRGSAAQVYGSDTFFQWTDTTCLINVPPRNSLVVDLGGTLGFFDEPAAGALVTVATDGRAHFGGLLWGTGNTPNYIVDVRAGGDCVYEAGLQPIATAAAVEDTTIGGVDRAWADVPYVNLAQLGQLVEEI